MSRRAVFLDKDGTVLRNVPYNADPARMELLPGAAAGLRRLARAGFALVVVSNQSGVARGYFPEEALEVVHGRLTTLFAGAGARLAGFFYCPHHPDGQGPYALACSCRKPAPGLVRRAASELGIDLSRSWMVGDILDDVEAGQRAGCRTVLVENGGETEWRFGPWRVPHYRAFDLAGAARCILEAEAPDCGLAAAGGGA